jgi:hypothetical protein
MVTACRRARRCATIDQPSRVPGKTAALAVATTGAWRVQGLASTGALLPPLARPTGQLGASLSNLGDRDALRLRLGGKLTHVTP